MPTRTLGERISALRRQRGWSQEELAARLEVSRQSVSKWESDASLPDLERIVRLAELFDVSMDELIKGPLELTSVGVSLKKQETSTQKISLEDAAAYRQELSEAARGIALAVALFILSPLCILVLGAFSTSAGGMLSERFVAGVGIATLFLLIAAGITLCLVFGMRLSKYKAWEQGHFSLSFGVYDVVVSEKEKFYPVYTKALTCAIPAMILGLIPMVTLSVIEASERLRVLSVALFLGCTAAAVYTIVRVAMPMSGLRRLLMEGDYSPEAIARDKKLAALPGIYWPLCTVLYLGISFLGQAWSLSWVVWPIAGVLYPALRGILRAVIAK